MKKRCIALLLAALLLPFAALATDGNDQAMALLEAATAANDPQKSIELLLQAGELAQDDVELLVSCAQLLFYFDETEEHADTCEAWLRHALSEAEGTARVTVLQVLTEQLIFANRINEAITLVEEAIAETPDNASLKITLATVLYYGDKGELAIEMLEDMIEDSPRNLEAKRLRAAILVDVCRWDDALQAYRQIQEEWPEYLDGTYGEYMTYIASGQFDKGLRAVDVLLGSGADDSLWLERARVRLWKQYQPEQALQEAEALLRKEPEWLDAATVKLASLLMLERYEEAAEVADEISMLDANYGGMLHAIALMNEGRWTEAEDELLSLVDELPTFTAAWKNISAIRLDGYDDLDGATQAIAAAFANSGGQGDLDMYLQLGEVYLRSNEMLEAARAYAMANTMTWEDPQPLYRLAMTCIDTGRAQDASDMVAEMERRYPGWYETMLARVVLEHSFGNARQALDAYNRFAEKFTFPASTMMRFEAIIRAAAQDVDEKGLAELLRIDGEGKEDASSWDAYAYGLILLDALDEAEDALEKAESLVPEAAKENGGLLHTLGISLASTRAELLLARNDLDGCAESLAVAAEMGWPSGALMLNPKYDALRATEAYQSLLGAPPEAEARWDLSLEPTIPEDGGNAQ